MPGAYGSFLCWALERFSKVRKSYHPPVTDNPLLPDGSSHAYASFCKVKQEDQFIDGLNVARNSVVPWNHNVYAGWPCGKSENLQKTVENIGSWMNTMDRLIVVVPQTPVDHYICYIRNEFTLDKTRWYDILGIEKDEQLYERMIEDIEADYSLNVEDPRILKLTISEILYDPPYVLFGKIAKLVGWPTCDFGLFETTLYEMRKRQEKYFNMITDANKGDSLTQRAITKFRLEYNNGFN